MYDNYDDDVFKLVDIIRQMVITIKSFSSCQKNSLSHIKCILLIKQCIIAFKYMITQGEAKQSEQSITEMKNAILITSIYMHNREFSPG